MADGAMLGLLYDAVDNVASFVQVFVTVYSLLILASPGDYSVSARANRPVRSLSSACRYWSSSGVR